MQNYNLTSETLKFYKQNLNLPISIFYLSLCLITYSLSFNIINNRNKIYLITSGIITIFLFIGFYLYIKPEKENQDKKFIINLANKYFYFIQNPYKALNKLKKLFSYSIHDFFLLAIINSIALFFFYIMTNSYSLIKFTLMLSFILKIFLSINFSKNYNEFSNILKELIFKKQLLVSSLYKQNNLSKIMKFNINTSYDFLSLLFFADILFYFIYNNLIKNQPSFKNILFILFGYINCLFFNKGSKNLRKKITSVKFFENLKQKSLKILKGNIIFNDVTINYNNQPLLQNINLQIQEKESILLYGNSGSGKSSIIKLLLKQIPYKGDIRVNGISLKDGMLNTALIDYNFFHDSILNNLLGGKIFTLDYIEKVLQALQIDFVEDFNTILDLNTFSSGQITKLVLAKTLFAAKYADVVMLDDITNSIDPNLVGLIVNNLIKLCEDKILIVTSNNSDIVKYFKNIYEVHNGTISLKKKNENLFLKNIEKTELVKNLIANLNSELIREPTEEESLQIKKEEILAQDLLKQQERLKEIERQKIETEKHRQEIERMEIERQRMENEQKKSELEKIETEQKSKELKIETEQKRKELEKMEIERIELERQKIEIQNNNLDNTQLEKKNHPEILKNSVESDKKNEIFNHRKMRRYFFNLI